MMIRPMAPADCADFRLSGVVCRFAGSTYGNARAEERQVAANRGKIMLDWACAERPAKYWLEDLHLLEVEANGKW
jgi:hypothetical protein